MFPTKFVLDTIKLYILKIFYIELIIKLLISLEKKFKKHTVDA